MAPRLGSSKTKRTKASVDYKPGMEARHCSICEHWIAGGRCEVVEGPIRGDYWCRLYRRRVGPE